MTPYGNEYLLKKIISEERKGIRLNISMPYLKLPHKIIDTINFSLLILVFVFFIISLDSQKKWSKTYKNLSRTIENNNNLIEYISKIEEFYLSKLDSSKNLKKTVPEDLIYLDNIAYKKENFLRRKFKYVLNGVKNSRYQKGY